MIEILMDYGLFLAKTVTLVIAVIVVIGVSIAMSLRAARSSATSAR